MTGTTRLLCTVAALGCLSLAGPVLASGGGGGGDLGSNEMPSVSTPRYDPAEEYQKGVTALKTNDFKTADQAFDHVLQASPNHLQTLILSGFTKASLNNFRGARDAYKKAISVDANQVQAHRGYALALVSLGDNDGANKELDVIKQRVTVCAGTCPQAADLNAAVSAVQAAMASGAKQSSIAPPSLLFGDAKSGDRAYVTAVADINQHHYDAALKSLKAAENVFGPHPDVLTYLGYTNRKLGHYDTAEAYYRQALAIAPNHRGATEYYGELKVVRGDMAGAKQMLAKLDSLCSFGCVEAEDLRHWIATGHE